MTKFGCLVRLKGIDEVERSKIDHAHFATKRKQGKHSFDQFIPSEAKNARGRFFTLYIHRDLESEPDDQI